MYLGVDLGSVSTDLTIIDENVSVLAQVYLPTGGAPIEATKEGLRMLQAQLNGRCNIQGVGTTGSGRRLADILVGADIVKNEITAHAVAASFFVPDVKTIIEIGGQDSKIIILRDGIPVDFAMNTVCAAGTGSFLDHQAARLGIAIEEFGKIALGAKSPARIAGRCTVFAESDMVHKQQVGCTKEDVIAGLCDALVRNYLANVAKGKEILEPIVFQGGVAANEGIKNAFEKELDVKLIIPEHFKFMGAIGVSMLAMEKGGATRFKGFSVADAEFKTSSFTCNGCPNQCEIVQIMSNGKRLACWGSICGKWK